MSWLFSRALAEGSSVASCLDGEQSAQSNGNPIQLAYLWHDKTTESWSRFPSGMTCKPLTESHGKELLTSYLEGFRAKTSAQPEKAQELTEPGQECGSKWPASWVRYDRDSSSWKTAQKSLLEDLGSSLLTWPEWGFLQDGECWELATLAPSIEEKECGFLPTPNCMDVMGPRSEQALARAKKKGGCSNLKDVLAGIPNPNWTEWLMGWPQSWTSLESKLLETAKFQQWQQQHGAFLEAL